MAEDKGDTETVDKSIDLNDLKNEIDKLQSLLRANEFGLISWHMVLDEKMRNVYNILSKVYGK
ncbi:hypothetical protein AUK11_00595 [bacterium CG2_30_37_16]|nr:MAG: hypothetical protein AUK11_00595 [bacterium CG2_30_37_16]PIP30417.1 MAG: hypothetical protein COX25_04995 [bacterium (Candidatus Howlettbacteria) CG23_combo_of_CG06-09_8_20_14_all_37_9]PIX99155.1 MAG: hypothetical protein COZ22_03275 [bacterium (Candidatus Howlettbacteria) CG_4_10_14_3_um_filter_37_10]PJB05902.1 MAG: hypothetical protein CO123_03265 [bacterium (Candidatus Howlettbacteria) CG_4_9_14_3_um_filter_37_10]